ncbi:MAG: IS110 family transposase [Clostridia bacterium]|nr:IS110 family transposase [Clostridia bacterium]
MDGRLLLNLFGGGLLISVGIDVSKGKSTICILKPYGEVLMSPRDFKHTQSDLKTLVVKLKKFNEETHIVLEATGAYSSDNV